MKWAANTAGICKDNFEYTSGGCGVIIISYFRRNHLNINIMETGLLHLHSFLRWVILLLLLIAIFKSATAGSRPFTNGHRQAGLFLMISADLELLIGLVLWFTGGVHNMGLPTIRENGMSAVMQNSTWRFYAIEHIIMMLIAVALIHIGKSFARKNVSDRKKHRGTVLFYVLALIIILAAVPWPFREVGAGRGWF